MMRTLPTLGLTLLAVAANAFAQPTVSATLPSSQPATHPATQPALGSNDAVGRYYDVNGCRLYVEVYGSGSPVICFHGNGGSMKAFRANVPFLAERHTVILVDSRAQGRSADAIEHPLTFEIMADDFAALLDQMHLAQADVIGFSDGAIDALMLAIRHPEKVRRIVATGANVTPDADAFKPGVWENDRQRYERDKLKTRTTDAERNAWKLFLLDWQQPHITAQQLGTIQSPSLIICGDHDLISVAHTAYIYGCLPHANLWVVPNSGHGTLIEHADAFNRAAEAFFSREWKDHQ